jgi:hypothetical protein
VATTALILFYEGGLRFGGRVYSPSVVLARFNEVRLAIAIPYSAFSTLNFPFISVCDSARLNSIIFSLSGSRSANRLEILFASPKAKVIMDYRLKSDLKSRFVVSPPLQLGHVFLGLERMYLSIQSLQNLCEHLR